ncbi:MAG TPA: PilZ domain-containing protein [Thermoanaerobaculia bacterium]|nr:PilZ domain-containing protein [Thermoanaerobaculia bacterium]
MNRRRSPRSPRRVQIQFWQPGEKIHRGYTTNLSSTGMHITTSEPLPPRSRLRVEIVRGERGFVVEGVVAHRRTVHPELAKVVTPGMGVRFLSPQELIHELFPDSLGGNGSRAHSTTGTAHVIEQDEGTERRIFSVRFASAQDFLGIYQRDIVNGGLFVATGRPGRVHEVVNVELFPPDGAPPVVLRARVVQRFQPEPGSGAILVGMGVELLDLEAALELLQPLIERQGR